MAYKRGRSASRSRSVSRRPLKRSKKVFRPRRPTTRLAAKVNSLYRMIETKETCRKTPANYSLPHNAVTIVTRDVGGDLNMFDVPQGTGDDMGTNGTARLGDAICVRGVSLKFMFENALERAKVYYRLMVIKCARGDTPTRSTLYKGDANNKMIDIINTERYTIVAQRIFNISCSNQAPVSVNASGVVSAGTAAGQGTKIVSMWIPGRKFGKGGNVQFENGGVVPKFFDYKVIVVAYDWYGTPQDVNTVGKINEGYAKLYFKDA